MEEGPLLDLLICESLLNLPVQGWGRRDTLRDAGKFGMLD